VIAAQLTATNTMASYDEAVRRLRHLMAAAVCLGLVFLSTSHVAVREQWAKRVVAKLAVLGGSRAIEPRMSMSLPHAPFRSAVPPRRADLRRTDPALALDVDALMASTLGSVHARDVADVLLSNWDSTIERLTRAVETSNSGAQWLDLACAYYMRGRTTSSLNDFCHALECLSRAGSSPEVTFNRALVLEQLRDGEAAEAEWRAYLAVDDSSAWAAEAHEHLQKTSRPASAGAPSRKQVERDLLPAWADAFLRGDTRAAGDALSAARSSAALLSHRSGDRTLPAIVSEIDQVPPEARRRLATALAAYGTGRRAVEQHDAAKAFRELLRAKNILDRMGSRGETLVTSYLVTARYMAGDHDGAERFAREIDRCRPDCTAAVAHTEWIRGMILFQRGYPSVSLQSFARSLAAFERLGEPEQQATQHTNLADTYQYLGDGERAAVHRYHALVLAVQIDDPRRLQPILTEAAEAAVSESLPVAAFVFQDRVVRVATASKDAFQMADSLTVRSTLHQRIGRRAEALRDLEQARRSAAAIDDAPSREKMFSDIDTAEAFAVREVDDRRAIDCLDRSIAFVRGRGSHIRLAQLLLERGRARLRLGDAAEAQRDFEDGIAELEDQRRRVGERELRIAYFDRAERLFSDLALLLLRRGLTGDAFDALERSRARELLEAATGRAMQPLPLSAIQRQLGPDVAVVTYMVTRDRVVAAIVTHGSLRFVERPLAEDELRRLVDNVSRGFDSPAGLARDDLRRLYDALIAPLRIEAGKRLVIVPDRFLYRVPFAALLASNGRYAVEDHVIAIAPSATVHVRNVARDCDLAARGDASVLVVASPERPVGFENLEPLLHTTREAAAIEKLYPDVRVLRSPSAETVVAEGGGHGVIHFGSHAVLNEDDPSESMLLLGANGRLRVSQIEARRFDRTRLVVLGTCSSGIGKTVRGEGVLSLARAFMSASVPSVVGTVAPVEDTTAARVLTSFHAAYARGLDPASALRHAQLAMLRGQHRSSADPARWSAFQAIGGACPSTRQREERTQWVSN
jgi:CHAT domain-containing protein